MLIDPEYKKHLSLERKKKLKNFGICFVLAFSMYLFNAYFETTSIGMKFHAFIDAVFGPPLRFLLEHFANLLRWLIDKIVAIYKLIYGE